MGQVWRGTDTTLGRQVAIKILPDAFAADPERLARFEREAKTLASLNHPHIAAIYGFEKSGGMHALVMELVEGEDLSQRIARGAISLEDALPIAAQIAEALEAAHEQGIIHRDLKPANIKVRADGTVKVLDFGLAKALEQGSGIGDQGSGRAQEPTVTTPAMTQAGMILGTAAYMSPEQARGKVLNRRTDIWAFGCVLYEMLTARRAFGDVDVSLTLSNVLRVEPDYTAIPAGVPPRIVRTLQACLQKDARLRAGDIHDVRLALDGAFETATPAPAVAGKAAASAWRLVLASAVGASLLAFGGGWLLKPSPSQEAGPVVRSSMLLPPGQSFSRPQYQSVALSPDGSRLAYVANGQVFLRRLQDLDSTPVPGTQAVDPRGIAFSPDSEWLAFHVPGAGQIVRIPVTGGAPVTVTQLERGKFAWALRWESDDTMLFVRQEGIERVPASGGTPERLVEPAAGKHERFDAPQLLPGGRVLLFTASGDDGDFLWDRASIEVQPLGSKQRRVVWTGGGFPQYLPTGHLAFTRAGALLAVPFDPDRLAVSGVPVQVLTGIETTSSLSLGGLGAHYTVSRGGMLAFVPGMSAGAGRTLVWVDRSGREEPLDVQAGIFRDPRLSPDGSRMAITAEDAGNLDIWVMDTVGRSRRRITFESTADRYPLWTPDGKALLFFSARARGRGVYRKLVDTDSAEEPLLVDPARAIVPFSWSADGQTLLTSELMGVNFDIGVATLGGEATRKTLLGSPFQESGPEVSPDGKWMAYISNEGGGANGVYVRPFPNVTSGVEQISTGGSLSGDPHWTRGGRELVYRSGDAILAVPIELSPTFRAGTPAVLFKGTYFNETGPQWDVTPDGNRFLMLKPAGASGAAAGDQTRPQIVLVQNWFEELKRLVPVK